jgi:hypothetical protein
MPSYITEPSVQTYPPVTIPQAVPTISCYSFGSLNEYLNNSPVEVAISFYAIATNVVTFTIVRNFARQFYVGETVVVSGIASPNNFLNGTYTVVTAGSTSFTAAKTHADVTTTAVSGLGTSKQSLNRETAEAIPADGTAGRQFAIRTAIQGADTQNSVAISWEVEYPSAPSTVEVHLEGAIRDVDSEYFQLAKSTVAAGDFQTVNWGASKVNFVRVKVISSTGGTSPTIISKFLV